MNSLKLIFISILLLLSTRSIASEAPSQESRRQVAGSVLSEESYVFTIEETQNLRIYIESLEDDIVNLNSKIELLKELDQNQKSQIFQKEELLKIKDLQISEFKNLNNMNNKRIAKLEKISAITAVERWGFFGAGVVITIAAVLIADKIDDAVESDSSQKNISKSNASILRF